MLISEADSAPNEDKLEKYINNVILSQKKESSLKQYYKIAISLLGAAGGIPFAEASYKASNGVPLLGYFFSAGTIIAYGAGSTWILRKTADHLFPDLPEEKELANNSIYYLTAKHTVCNMLSVTATAIPLYTAYKFNSLRWLTIISGPISYGFNVFGFYTMLDEIRPRQSKETVLKLLNIFRCVSANSELLLERQINLQSLIERSLIKVNTLDKEELHNIYKKIFKDEIEAKNFIGELKSLSDNLDLSPHYRKATYIVQVLSTIIPICNIVVNSYLGFEASKYISNNIYFSIFFIALTSTPAFFMDTYITTGAVGQLFNSAVNRVRGLPNSNFISKEFPFTNIISGLLSFIIAALSSANKGYVTYSTINGPIKWFFTTISVVSSMIFETCALNEIFSTTLEYFISEWGNNSYHKESLAIHYQLNQLNKMLSKADPSYLKSFINKESNNIIVSEEINTDEESEDIDSLITHDNGHAERKISLLSYGGMFNNWRNRNYTNIDTDSSDNNEPVEPNDYSQRRLSKCGIM